MDYLPHNSNENIGTENCDKWITNLGHLQKYIFCIAALLTDYIEAQLYFHSLK